jgi:FtsP/CotA-like multicopper oxidase with cupredoxin domain
MKEGKPVTVDIFNDTSVPELIHWHGQIISAQADGAEEESSPFVPPHGHLRVHFTPRPAGTRCITLM